MGMKKSAANNKINRQPVRSTLPALNCVTERIMPSAAPPYAIRSMIVMELSCIVSTFIVILRNFSDSLFISSFFQPSLR